MSTNIIENDTLEIMEFAVGDSIFGINIAKVREVVQFSEPTPSPDQNPCVEGILMLRGTPIPIINLEKRLNTTNGNANTERHLFIITSFNKLLVGLHVHRINGIRKLSWADTQSPDETIVKHGNNIITGIVKQKDYLLILLDFEKIVADINPVTTIQVKDVKTAASAKNANKPILIVDDSMMLNNLIRMSLQKAGYTNIISKNNGQEAWDFLTAIEDKKNAHDTVSIIISDIEMPVMDGITLCKKIKEDNLLSGIPIIMFSSIIEESMSARCKEAGADYTLSKPQIDQLVGYIEDIL